MVDKLMSVAEQPPVTPLEASKHQRVLNNTLSASDSDPCQSEADTSMAPLVVEGFHEDVRGKEP